MDVKEYFKAWSPYGSRHMDESTFDGFSMIRFAEEYHLTKSKEEAETIRNTPQK